MSRGKRIKADKETGNEEKDVVMVVEVVAMAVVKSVWKKRMNTRKGRML